LTFDERVVVHRVDRAANDLAGAPLRALEERLHSRQIGFRVFKGVFCKRDAGNWAGVTFPGLSSEPSKRDCIPRQIP